MDTVLAWHFTDGPTLRDGSPLPPVGEWLAHDGPVVICESGLHASRRLVDALGYAPGTLCHRVEVRGVVAELADKLVARERRILASVEVAPVLLSWSRWCALRVAHLWDCPPEVRHFLETGENSEAAWEAAARAVRAAWAARATAWAAREAREAAAREAAARAAREAAARATAWAAREAREAAVRAAWAARAAARAAREAREAREAAAREAAAWAAEAAEAAEAEAAARADQNAELERLMLAAMGLTNTPAARI